MVVLTKPPTNAGPRRPVSGRPVRSVLAAVVGTVALALTGWVAWGVVDLATREFEGKEMLVVEMILGVTGLLALYAWAGALALLRSSRGTLPRRPVVRAAFVAAPLCVMAAVVLPPVLDLVALGFAAVATVVALGGVIRR